MKKTLKFALVSAFMVAAPAALAADSAKSCKDIQATVEKAVKADEAKVLEIVEAQVSANSGCACEVVKAAIISMEANKELVRQIVEVAVVAAPNEMRLVAQCAVAVAPDAVGEVQEVIASFDRHGGESPVVSAKGGLGAKSPKGGISPASPGPDIQNPLDGPLVPGGAGSDPFLPEFPIFQPPTLTPGGFSPID